MHQKALGGPPGPFIQQLFGIVHYEHPCILNLHGCVPFAGIAGKKKNSTDWDFGEGGSTQKR